MLPYEEEGKYIYESFLNKEEDIISKKLDKTILKDMKKGEKLFIRAFAEYLPFLHGSRSLPRVLSALLWNDMHDLTPDNTMGSLLMSEKAHTDKPTQRWKLQTDMPRLHPSRDYTHFLGQN